MASLNLLGFPLNPPKSGYQLQNMRLKISTPAEKNMVSFSFPLVSL